MQRSNHTRNESCLVFGSKDWTDRKKIAEVLGKNSIIVLHASPFAELVRYDYICEILPFDTDGFEYLKTKKFDRVVAFQKGNSRGTEIVIMNAKQLGIDIEVIKG